MGHLAGRQSYNVVTIDFCIDGDETRRDETRQDKTRQDDTRRFDSIRFDTIHSPY